LEAYARGVEVGEGVGCFGDAVKRSVTSRFVPEELWRRYAESVYGNGVTAKNEKISGNRQAS
jgi:hypothetical protein